MHKPRYMPITSDLMGEHTRHLLEANDIQAQEELGSLMNYLSLHMANPGKQAGTSVGKSDAAAQYMDAAAQHMDYPMMDTISPSTGCGTSTEGARSSFHGSSGEPGSTGVGSRSASQTGSGNGTGSRSGSGKGSSINGSGYNGGSDGYSGDGSTGSGCDNCESGSDNDPNENSESQPSPKSFPSGRVMPPPGLVDERQYLGVPMKVEVGSNLSQDQPHVKNKSMEEMLAHFEERLQGAVPTPAAIPATSVSTPGPSVDSAMGFQAAQSTSDLSPLGDLLQMMLLQVARNSSPEDTMEVCGALAESLTAVLLRKSAAVAPTPEMDQKAQMLQVLQKDIERHQELTQALFTQKQAPWQQGLDQKMAASLQQERQRMNAGMSACTYPVPAGLGAPPIVPPLGTQCAAGHGIHTPVWSSPAAPHSTGLGLPPVLSPSTSQLEEELRMRHLLRQELDGGWMQSGAQFITPDMINMGLQISTEAAHQAAAAWQRENASLAWQQQSPLAWQQAGESSGASRSAGPGMFLTPQGMSSPSPLLPHQMPDPSLQFPCHQPSSLTAQMLRGHNFQPASDVPMSVPLPMQTAPAVLPGHKVYMGDGDAKGQRKGAGKGGGMNKRSGRNGVHASSGHAPKGGYAVPPEAFGKGLRANLETLRSMDSTRILQVRKINQLGFESAEVLEKQFSRYGQVVHVLVSHCYAKARNLRMRPSCLGFVVMSTAAEVQTILANGPEMKIRREVEGVQTEVPIRVQAFEPRMALEAEKTEGEP